MTKNEIASDKLPVSKRRGISVTINDNKFCHSNNRLFRIYLFNSFPPTLFMYQYIQPQVIHLTKLILKGKSLRINLVSRIAKLSSILRLSPS